MKSEHRKKMLSMIERARNVDLVKVFKNFPRFHQYSFRNTLFILAQKEDATRVAGFTAWKRLGRHVKKGEKGLMIVAPRTYTATEETKTVDKHTGDVKFEQEEVTRTYFVPVYVYDLSQTEGEPLPVMPYAKTENFNLDDYADLICKIGTEVNIIEKPLGYGSGGYMDENGITINSNNPVDWKYRTLFHELGHVLCEHLKENSNKNRAQQEVEAELFCAYWTSQAGYEYKHEIYIGSWLDNDINPIDVINNVDLAINKAKKILSEPVKPIEVLLVPIAAEC